jgi:Protein of unknown function (DUF3105)
MIVNTWDGPLNGLQELGIHPTHPPMTPLVAVCRRLFWNSPRSGSIGPRALTRGAVTTRRCIGAPGSCAAHLGLVVVMAGCSSRNPTVNESTLPMCADAGGQYQEDVFDRPSQVHTEEPQAYDGYPPAGGPHSGCWGDWGVHTAPLRPERFVHNLEHGGIVLTYNCPEGCSKELRWMQEFALTNELVVVTEYPDLTSRFGISAWNARAYSDCLSPDFVRDFYARRVDRAPEEFSRPPPGPPSSCL